MSSRSTTQEPPSNAAEDVRVRTAVPPTPLRAKSSYRIEELQEIADKAQAFLEHARRELFAPDAKKHAPRYSMAQIAQFVGIDKSVVSRRISNPKDPLPKGVPGQGGSRSFDVPMVQAWSRAYGLCHIRSEDQPGFVITVGNFKGGVSKTTTAANLALGLSLRGYRCLMIDFDSQASLTSLMGIQPEFEVLDEDTFLPLTTSDDAKLRDAIRETYWPGVDIVCASVSLNEAEFFLPVRQAESPDYRFWSVLSDALVAEGIRDEYDYIIIDTPPAMSYLTLNAFWAADGLLVPLPPEGPDFASAASFWNLFSQLARTLDQRREDGVPPKVYHWIKVLPTKVDRQKAHTQELLSWIGAVYGSLVSPVEIPATSVVSVAGAQMGSIYDISRYVGSARAYQRARQAYDDLVKNVDESTRTTAWASTPVAAGNGKRRKS